MNKVLTLLLFLFPFSLFCYSVNTPPKISLSIPQEIAIEGREIILYINVVHARKQKIDPQSFMIEDKPLSVTPLEESPVGPPSLFSETDQDAPLLSRYKASLGKKAPGVYTIGPISLVANGTRFSSETITINVQGAVTSEAFRLEARVLGPSKLFIGQEVLLEYRIYFKKPMQVLREELPLLSTPGFLPLGAASVTVENENTGSVQIVSQKARALNSGIFEIKASVLDGMEVEAQGDTRLLIPPLLRAIAPQFAITILGFPEKDKPTSFYGALGSFTWRVRLLDGNSFDINEPFRIEYRVSGRGELSTVRFPSLDSIPGLLDSFFVEGALPEGKEEDGTKTFVLKLRGKRAGSFEIPRFFVSSFDPSSATYLTATVPSLSVTIEKAIKEEKQEGETFSFPISQNLTLSTLQAPTFPNSWTLTSVIILIVLSILQYFMKKILVKKSSSRSSQQLFYEAFMKREKGLKILQDAFYLRLFELGLTEKVEESIDALEGKGGVCEEVHHIIDLIDKKLYNNAPINVQELLQEASLVYHHLKQMQRVSV